jgi:hypothetical protein
MRNPEESLLCSLYSLFSSSSVLSKLFATEGVVPAQVLEEAEACFSHLFSLAGGIMDEVPAVVAEADSISVVLAEVILAEAVPEEIFNKSVSLRKNSRRESNY